jgi:N-acetylmuramoyl-L-alanine amidase
MQQVHARGAQRSRPYVLAAALLAAALVMAFAAPAAFAGGVTCTLSAATVDYGQPVTVTGVVDPVAAGQPVAIALDGVAVATATTDAAGQFTASFTPTKGGSVSAVIADGTSSAPVALSVRLVVSVKVLRVAFWSSVTMNVTIAPDTYAGPIVVRVTHRGKSSEVQVTAKGRLTAVRVPITGVGPFSIKVSLPAAEGLLAQDAAGKFTVRGNHIRAGSHGDQVRVILRSLVALHFRVPGVSASMSTAGTDAVVAFQKAYKLPRTYVFDDDDWRKLETATVLKPRYSKPTLHIEVDKTRQILMVVRNGSPLGILAVSTGATNNTPEGTHSIEWKAYSAHTPYGGGLLYWDMQFAPGFAMHAYPFVPPYPASHGCVRQPNWVAPWTYSVSSVGETVYVYH